MRKFTAKRIKHRPLHLPQEPLSVIQCGYTVWEKILWAFPYCLPKPFVVPLRAPVPMALSPTHSLKLEDCSDVL